MSAMFVPSSTNLNGMLAAAMAKCDAGVEQAALKREAKAEARMARAIESEVIARRRKALYA